MDTKSLLGARIRERRSVFRRWLFPRRLHARSKRGSRWKRGIARKRDIAKNRRRRRFLEISGPVITFRPARSYLFRCEKFDRESDGWRWKEERGTDGLGGGTSSRGNFSWKPKLLRACTLQVATSLCANWVTPGSRFRLPSRGERKREDAVKHRANEVDR